MIIGITGSSGAGKSTVCEILAEKYQVKVLNADKIAKQLSQKGNAYLDDIVELFGQEILREDGELDRPKLANIIYNDDEKREKLNQSTFYHIRYVLQEEILNMVKQKDTMIAIDAPLLLEANLQQMCDVVIAVIVRDKELQIKRIMQRDWLTKEQAEKRLQVQMTDEFYTSKSQYIIVNNGEIKAVEEQVNKIMKEIVIN